MSEWRHVRLEEVSEFAIGGTPSRNTPEFWAEPPDGHPWLSISDLKGKFVSDTSEHISPLGASASNTKLIPENTTVMSFKLTVGRTAITTRSMYGNEAIAFFRPNDHEVDGRWLYHELPRASKRVVTDTAVKGATLNKKKLASIPLHLPPYREQKIIAQILDTLDTQIHQTEALIAKLETVKQGLLTDLLTRGIDENGQLRPPPDEVPYLYGSSVLGRVPRAWSLTSLGDTATITVGFVGTTSPFYTLDQTGVLFLRTGNITGSGLDLSDVMWVKPKFHQLNQKSALQEGDVVVSRVGYTGNAAVVPALGEANCANMIIIRCGEKLLPDFLRLLFSSYLITKQVAGFTIGSAQPVFNINLVKRLKIAIPSIHEQRGIVGSINSLERQVEKERSKKQDLENTKSGLMDDLLTGRVRINAVL